MSLLIPGTNSIKDTGYDVANSLRFNDGSNDYLSISGITPTNSKKFTYSFWVKRTVFNTDQAMLSYESDSNNRGGIELQTGELFRYFERVGGSTVIFVEISSLFKDPSAWYNIIVATDTTQSTESDRVKIYVNGVLQTSFATSVTYPSLNSDTRANGTSAKNIGRRNVNNDYYFDGYLAEVVFIDGSQLDQTSFGEFDSDSPRIWKPKDVSGLTFGNAGFYLDFENSSSLGADVSGNSNNFTVNNLTSVDQSTDTCTNNFATFNSLSANDSGTVTFSEGNLQTAHSGSDSRYTSYSTIGVSSGKWYAEVKYEAKSSNSQNDLTVGVAYDVENLNRQGNEIGTSSGSFSYVGDNGEKLHDGSSSSYGSTFTTGDIIGIFLDLDNHKLYFSKNGSVVASGDPTSGSSGTNAAFSLDTGETYFICAGHGTSTSRETTYSMNFGSPIGSISSGNQDPNGYGNFEYSPQGYYALNTKNLAEFG